MPPPPPECPLPTTIVSRSPPNSFPLLHRPLLNIVILKQFSDPVAIHHLLYLYYVLYIPYMGEIFLYLSVSFWLTSLSMNLSSSIHLATNYMIFTPIAKYIYIHIFTTLQHFLYLIICLGNLDCFQILDMAITIIFTFDCNSGPMFSPPVIRIVCLV